MKKWPDTIPMPAPAQIGKGSTDEHCLLFWAAKAFDIPINPNYDALQAELDAKTPAGMFMEALAAALGEAPSTWNIAMGNDRASPEQRADAWRRAAEFFDYEIEDVPFGAWDKYDDAIEYLRAHPDEIRRAWFGGYHDVPIHPGACLFAAAGSYRSGCSCLTIIRDELSIDGGARAATPELTEAIRADERIPKNPSHICVEHLPVFAEWQRKIDAMGVR